MRFTPDRPAARSAPTVLSLTLVVALVAAACLPALGSPAPSGSAGPSGSPSASAAGPTPTPTLAYPTPTPGPTFLVHVVATGDSLNSIAGRYETSARSIAYWNRVIYPSLDPDSAGYRPNLIEVGWMLQLIPGVVLTPDTVPTLPPASQAPRPTLAPGASPRPIVTPAPGAAAIVVSRGPTGTNRVALTLDMGGRLDPAREIMAWLAARDVPATIFPTGASATEQAIGRDVLRAVAARPDLFELGNHSWDHPYFTDLSAAAIADQLVRSETAISAATGATTRPWFRPPYGSWDGEVRQAVGDAGWAYLVLWDIDTIDWRPTADGGPTAGDIEAKVLARAGGGSIVLMHLGGWNTLAALPGIVDGLRSRGLEPVTLSELFFG